MHLQRVVVPDFRVLKDVDITFEKDFTPSVFPLGSQNGGGKSTLLQLIFVLLHCSNNPWRCDYLQNLLSEIVVENEARLLATFEIIDGENTVTLHFKVINDEYLKNIALPKYKEVLFQYSPFNYSFLELLTPQEEQHEMLPTLNRIIEHEFESNSCSFITTYRNDWITNALICEATGFSSDLKLVHFLHSISTKIYLAAPSTQTYLFLPQRIRKSLLSRIKEPNMSFYTEQLQKAKSYMENFFTYDFLSFDLLVDSFKEARDNDFREAVKTGTYGQSYLKLLNSLNNLLADKQITLNEALDDVVIRLKDGTEINVEDLSHGELKRLTLFLWLMYHTEKDAIILMDEVENALHPDWQYGAVRDLEEWAPSTQFILATHSYELCEAVTPAHVKMLEPKLQKRSTDGND